MAQEFTPNCLVLYKKSPALVGSVAAKIAIQVAGGKSVNVREKDIQLLHGGPLKALKEIETAPEGDVNEAWELLQGETVSLEELAEYIYGDATPAAAWQAWKVLDEGTYFLGSITAITARKPEGVQAILDKALAKEREAALWDEYLERVKRSEVLPEDFPHLSDIQRLAYRKASTNRTLKALDIEILPEKAHRMLLQLGIWDDTINPYPARFDCAVTQPEFEVPELPEEDREDLTHLAAYAIDDDNCSDPDDAISIDGDCLWIHVADAAALIPPDSEIDLEARSRGANLYLPEGVINMLPSKVTEVLGLGLQERSPALSFKIEISEDGTPVCAKATPSWIEVERTSYSIVDQKLDEEPFAGMRRLTEPFRARRMAQGAAELILPEVKLKTTVEGELYHFNPEAEVGLREQGVYNVEIKDLPRLKSRELVTDAMLMAGEAVADFLIENQISAPFASQPAPDEICTPVTLSDMFGYRKKFKRSQLHLVADNHAGLGLERYTRVTSPLRRYSDLLVHQQLRAFLAGKPLISEDDMLPRMAEAEMGGSNTSRAERQSNRHWTLLHMQQQPDTIYRGVVVDKMDDRGTIMIPELAIDVKMRRMADAKLDSEVYLKLFRVNLADLDFNCRLVKAPAADA